MTISREDVDRRAVDFADVMAGRRLPPVHPGQFLRDEFLEPLDLSVYALARALNVPRPRLNEVVRGRRAVSTDTALRLARYFGTSPQFWINLQARYEARCCGTHATPDDRQGSQAPRRLKCLTTRPALAVAPLVRENA